VCGGRVLVLRAHGESANNLRWPRISAAVDAARLSSPKSDVLSGRRSILIGRARDGRISTDEAALAPAAFQLSRARDGGVPCGTDPVSRPGLVSLERGSWKILAQAILRSESIPLNGLDSIGRQKEMKLGSGDFSVVPSPFFSRRKTRKIASGAC
jgi:hypothetical protein